MAHQGHLLKEQYMGETLTFRILIGMLIIMGGISLVNYGSK